jgi:hypothetical protein
MRIVHSVHEATTIEDMSGNIPRIYASLKNRYENHRSNMIKVEGKIANYPIAILIYLGASHIYHAHNLVE